MERKPRLRPNEVKEYVDQKQWTYRLEGKNYKLNYCLFCGNEKYNFEIEKDYGIYKCWACGVSGNFFQLRQHRGDVGAVIASPLKKKENPINDAVFKDHTEKALKAHDALFLNPVAHSYLTGRGFSDESIRHFKLGCIEFKGVLYITIPHIENRRVVNIKYRAISGATKWVQEKIKKQILFNVDALSGAEEIILVEGELKAVALWQVGIHNVVALSGTESFRPEWMDALAHVKKVYMCLDSDDPGKLASEKLAQRIGLERCYNILLDDAKDPDEWLFKKNHTADEFRFLVKSSKLFDVKNLTGIDSVFLRLRHELSRDPDEQIGLQTPWNEVNNLISGFKPGHLVILSAPPKYGKTSLALQMSVHIASNNNPVLFWCLEMRPEEVVRKIVQSELKIDNSDPFSMETSDVSYVRYMMRNTPYYLPTHIRATTPDDIFETIRAAYKRYGIKLVIFDNLAFLTRTADNVREMTGVVTQGFKLLAEELQIPIILIVHPRKLNSKRSMTAEDLKDSSSIHADADMILLMHRKRIGGSIDDSNEDPQETDDEAGILDPETYVIVEASRFCKGGVAKLYFEGGQSRFYSLTER